MLVDEGQIYGEACPNCNSRSTFFDPVFGFWKCEDCSTVWGHDADDPDWDELDPHDRLLKWGDVRTPIMPIPKHLVDLP